MRNLLADILKFLVFVLVISGGYFIYNSKNHSIVQMPSEKLSAQAQLLKQHLMKYSAPSRIEINNLTKRLSNQVVEIKKIKIPLKKESEFYISIDLFTDENDKVAPLVAQIQYFENKTDNKIKEESINLDDNLAP